MAAVNKQAVAAAFGRAASHYSQHDALQRYSAELLLRQLHGRAFSAGAGRRLRPRQHEPLLARGGSHVTALDLSVEMLAQAQRNECAHRYLLGILSRCRWPDACVDLAWSNLAVQWCESLPARSMSCAGWCARRSGGVYHLAGRSLPGAESGLARH
jgi:malonyl-CoA O-methyltransferase